MKDKVFLEELTKGLRIEENKLRVLNKHGLGSTGENPEKIFTHARAIFLKDNTDGFAVQY